tara:strand:- start:1302 stop:1655 length:354 start_codon:yes stop_codon:yes gene_type:complete
MAIFNLKKDKDTVTVSVELPVLADRASIAKKEVVRLRQVRKYLRVNNIEVYECLGDAGTLSNSPGGVLSGEFIFSIRKKDLTSQKESVIVRVPIEKTSPGKRKRTKNEVKAAGDTTS